MGSNQIASSATSVGSRVPSTPLLIAARGAWQQWQTALHAASTCPQSAAEFAASACLRWQSVEAAALQLGLSLAAQSDDEAPTAAAAAVPEDATEGAALPDEDKAKVMEPGCETVSTHAVPISVAVAVPHLEVVAAAPKLALGPIDLHKLAASMNGDRPQLVEPQAVSVLANMRKSIGRTPTGIMDRKSVVSQIAQLGNTIQWRDLVALEPADRRLALEWLAARVRVVQGAPAYAAIPGDPVMAVARLLTRALELGTSGHVNGLSYKHVPRTDSWLTDAMKVEHEIDTRTGRVMPDSEDTAAAAPHVQICDLFRQLRDAAGEPAADHSLALTDKLLALGVRYDDPRWRNPWQDRIAELPDTISHQRLARSLRTAPLEAEVSLAPANQWPFLHLTRGKRAVILGGDGKQARVPKIQAAFGFAHLDWPDLPENSPRAASVEVEKLRNGHYDFALVIQKFISHSVTDQVFSLANQGFVAVLAQGYGVGQLQRGLERYLGQEKAA